MSEFHPNDHKDLKFVFPWELGLEKDRPSIFQSPYAVDPYHPDPYAGKI